MNHPFSTSIVLTSRPTDRVVAALGDRLDSAKRALSSLWSDYQVRRREARALTGIDEMDPHMLRDIGASDRLIERAAEGRPESRWRGVPFQWAAVLLASAVVGTTAPTSVAEAAGPQVIGKGYAQTEMVGVFTGEFVDGAPVYRFPPVVVVGSRAEPFRSAERVAQPRPVKAPAGQGPAEPHIPGLADRV